MERLLRASWRLLRRTLIAIVGVIGVLFLILAVGAMWPLSAPMPQAQRVPVAVVGVTIVDVRHGRLIAGQTVVTNGTRITAVGSEREVAIPEDAERLDGRGRFLMPALWDMHAHVYAVSPMTDLSLSIAYGVTNVRDLQGCPAAGDPFIACYEDKQRWTREAEAGTRIAPRIFEASSFMANGPGMAARLNNVPEYFDTATPEQARQFVRHFRGRADSIKVYDNIPRDAYFALVDEARRHGLPVVGHKPRSVSAVEAAVHQRSLEHARFLLHESFDGSDELRGKGGTPGWSEDRRAMVDRHDPAKAQHIFRTMREHGVFYVPTHLTRWSDAYADQAEVREDAALTYLHPLMKMQWQEDIDELIQRAPAPASRQAYRDFYRTGLDLTRRAQASGVKIMVGTDYIVAGLDVHRELEQLVLAGLTPPQALQAAITTPADYARAAERFGDVAPRKIADLVLLTQNPLADIRNTRTIEAVLFNGTVYGPAAIDRIKRHVRSNARSWTIGAKMIWRFLRQPANY
jgi:imidazolonepropionase-like amidohydrolase